RNARLPGDREGGRLRARAALPRGGTMTFTATQVRENWGAEGVEIIDDLMRHHGTEVLPDPVRNESLVEYLERCDRAGLCHVAGDQHILQNVQARAEAEDL